MQNLTITCPDDWHLHLRDGVMLKLVACHSARQFGRALVMPNLNPPITHLAQAYAYRERIIQALPQETRFTPYLSLYLTEETPPDEIISAARCPHILGFKLYPAGATTFSDAGIRGLESIYPLLEVMENHNVVLQIHGEVTDKDIDIFDREKIFIDRELSPLVARFPALRIVLEHITTREGIEFVSGCADNVAGTLTPQHLLYNRNALLAGGIRPHFYCLPVLKGEAHRQALLKAAVSGNPKFFLGTDSAPHRRQNKETACGCAGCFTAPLALELYAESFEQAGALDKLEAFASHYGADFYHLPRNAGTVTLVRSEWQLPEKLSAEEVEIIPLRAGQKISWRLKASTPETSFQSVSSSSCSSNSSKSSSKGGSPS